MHTKRFLKESEKKEEKKSHLLFVWVSLSEVLFKDQEIPC